ncbi:unnamed protein product, partial [Iphiclides podalirius]
MNRPLPLRAPMGARGAWVAVALCHDSGGAKWNETRLMARNARKCAALIAGVPVPHRLRPRLTKGAGREPERRTAFHIAHSSAALGGRQITSRLQLGVRSRRGPAWWRCVYGVTDGGPRAPTPARDGHAGRRPARPRVVGDVGRARTNRPNLFALANVPPRDPRGLYKQLIGNT